MGLFSTLLGRPRAERIARFPHGRVGYAVGDIHGRADLLARMLDRLEADATTSDAPVAVFLGDYIDRGPDSRLVLELLLEPRPRGFERRFLLGNHEAALLAFLRDPEIGRAWLRHGGVPTLRAYGVTPPSLDAPADAFAAAAAALRARMPALHRDFLERLERSVVYGGYAFVHAGVDPRKPLEAQSDRDLLWAREAFLKARRAHEYVIVHGHTPEEKPYADHRRIGVDTGAYATGKLTAVRLVGADVSFLTLGPT